MSNVCSGGTTQACMNAVGAGSTFTATHTILQGLMYAVGFIFVLYVIYQTTRGLGPDKITFHQMFSCIIWSFVMIMMVLGMVETAIK